MPSIEDHRQQSSHNKCFLTMIQNGCSDEEYTDWKITVMFYTILHLVDTKLAIKLFHPNNHSERNLLVNREDDFKKIRRDYIKLCTFSRAARYDYGYKISQSDYSKAQSAYEGILTCFK